MNVDTLGLVLLKYIMLFSLGSMAGWIIELFWRRFGESKRWINPGFLNGPWLPLYGFGAVILYLLSLLEFSLLYMIPVFFIILTLLEYVAGIIFIRFFKIKLWDYSKQWGNLHGLICPLYSLFWAVLGTLFYVVLFPQLQLMIQVFYGRLQLSFFIGIYGGLFGADLWGSSNLAARIRTFVADTVEKKPIHFERLKLELRDHVHEGFINRTKFFLPFHGETGSSFRDRLRSHLKPIPNPRKVIKKVMDKRQKK